MTTATAASRGNAVNICALHAWLRKLKRSHERKDQVLRTGRVYVERALWYLQNRHEKNGLYMTDRQCKGTVTCHIVASLPGLCDPLVEAKRSIITKFRNFSQVFGFDRIGEYSLSERL